MDPKGVFSLPTFHGRAKVGAMITSFAHWLAVGMLAWAGVKNPSVEKSARFESVASDIVAVAFDESEAPLFTGPAGRVRTAALLASIAGFESGGLDPKVDTGERRGDGGKSYCMMQINLGKRRIVLEERGYRYSYSEGWTGQDLLDDRQKCIRAALHVARASYDTCGTLSGYTAGKCLVDEPAARARVARGKVLAGSWVDNQVVIDALAMMPTR